MVRFALEPYPPALAVPVLHVISVSAEEQMVGINTSRIIAPVENM
jgi:hypothetical protein